MTIVWQLLQVEPGKEIRVVVLSGMRSDQHGNVCIPLGDVATTNGENSSSITCKKKAR